MAEARVQCPFCRAENSAVPLLTAEDYEYSVPGEYQLGKCRACGFCFQIPMPTPEEIPKFYPPGYNTYEESGESLSRWLHRRYYLVEGKRIADLIGRSGRVLDVGCGNGVALEMFAKCGEWSLGGVEIDPASASDARRRGFEIWEGRFEDVAIPENSFDLIRMSHYLEHVTDPLINLRQACRLLKPGGLLYMETPHIESWDFAFWGRYWGALHFPRHLIFPSRRHARDLLQRAGLIPSRILSRLRTCGWSAGLQNFLRDKIGLRVPQKGGRVKWYPALVGLCLPISIVQALCNRPGAVAYIARKPAV